MPLRLLADLERASLPLTITDPDAIRQVEMLRAALLVRADLRKSDEKSPYSSAVVIQITPTGYSVLARMEAKKRGE